MATLKSNATWGSSPTITFDFSYEKKREGSTQYYKVTVSCDPLTGTHYFGYPIYLEIKLDGTQKATKTLKTASPSQWSSSISYTTGWLAVQNKTSGTTALAIRIYSGLGSSRNTTYSYTLPIDPAASKIAATDANIESVSTISITKYDANFTTTVSYKAEGQSSYTPIWTNQTHTTYGWTVPSSLYSLIPDKKKIEITFQCQTYNGSTLMGTETCTMTATTNQSKCEPIASVSAVDLNAKSIALTGNNQSIILGISRLGVVTTATARNGATLSSITASCGGQTLTGASVIFTIAQSATVHVVVTDSRGYSKRVDVKSLSAIGYISPTIIPTIVRDTPTGDTVTVSVRGKWYNGSFGATSNTLSVAVRYKTTDEANYGSYVSVPITKNGNEYTGTIQLTGIDYMAAYSFEVRLNDAIYTDYSGKTVAVPLSKGIPVFDWGEEDFRFNVPVGIMGQRIADFIIECGIEDIWYYEKYASGIAKLYGKVNVNQINENVMGWTKNFPFNLSTIFSATATCNYAAGGTNSWAYPFATKAEVDNTKCSVYVQASVSSFGVDNAFPASAFVVGTWK
jgi:hypothetical protein